MNAADPFKWLVAFAICLGLLRPCGGHADNQRNDIGPAVVLNVRDLGDKSALVREAAAINLYNIGTSAGAAAPALISRLATEPNPNVRLKLVKAIGNTAAQSPDAVPALIQILQRENDDEMRLAAVASLGRLGVRPDLSVPPLLLGLKDHSDDVRSEAAEALGNKGFAAMAATIVPALANALVETKDGNAFNLTKSLIAFGPTALPALPQMRALLADPHEDKRLAAAQVIASMGRAAAPAATQVLATLSDSDVEVRVESAIALLAIGEHDAVAMGQLIEALAFDDGLSVNESLRNKVIPRAAWAIGEYGKVAPAEVIARLAALTDARDEDIRHFAAEAFSKVLSAIVVGHRVEAIAPLMAAVPLVGQTSDGATRRTELEDAIAMLKKSSSQQVTQGWGTGSIGGVLAAVFALAVWAYWHRSVVRRRHPRVLLSYRREDSAAYCGRIYDRCAVPLGTSNVFRDIDSLAPGDLFAEKIRDFIGRCDVVIVLIGPRWLTVIDASGRRRLDDPADFVRMEIAEAAKQAKRVVPVLLEGAQMPGPQQLPPDIAFLAQRNAVEITDRHFGTDMQKLLDSLG